MGDGQDLREEEMLERRLGTEKQGENDLRNSYVLKIDRLLRGKKTGLDIYPVPQQMYAGCG